MTPETVEITRETTSRRQETVVVGREAAWNDSARYRAVPLSVPREELFFWTAKWQSGERQSAEQREAGNLVRFEKGTDLLNWLAAPED